MNQYHFRLLNVFAKSALAGNALCVFEDARGMSDAQMQALALQFNLSETTFLFPSNRANARVRIFSPSTEFPFAGHPVLGSAAVVADMQGATNSLSLETNIGNIEVTFAKGFFELKAVTPKWRSVTASGAELAQMLNLRETMLGDPILWMNAGFEQLLIPLRSIDALKNVRLDANLAQQLCKELGSVKIYLWAHATQDIVHSRFFFSRGSNLIGEDPGTGSACANLGGWLIATDAARPLSLSVHQGDHLGRPCRLSLKVSEQGDILVGGLVVELGRGRIQL